MSASSEQLQKRTIEFWQPLAKRNLTREDARQITENLGGFFNLLNVWAASRDNQESHPDAESKSGGIQS